MVETVNLLGRTLGADIELLTHLQTDLWNVNADAGQLQQVLLNLALNARDAMPQGGRLLITTENVSAGDSKRRGRESTDSDQVLLIVTDNGEGMPERVREKIFEPFFTTKPAGKGTGLGLAMVYGIVKQNHGQIWVSTELTKGTVFKIYLPRSGAAQVKQSLFVPGWGTETVLVVEDQVALRGTIVDMLRDYGYTAMEAGDGLEALEIIDEQMGAIHLVITDVVMPRMSGADLSTRLREHHPNIKLLFISGYVGDQVHRQGGLGKDVIFVQKPFSPSALVGKVRQVLDLKA